jgi:hypothetical protein
MTRIQVTCWCHEQARTFIANVKEKFSRAGLGEPDTDYHMEDHREKPKRLEDPDEVDLLRLHDGPQIDFLILGNTRAEAELIKEAALAATLQFSLTPLGANLTDYPIRTLTPFVEIFED